LGLTEEELYQRVRDGGLIAYRAHSGDQWEWRVDRVNQAPHDMPLQATGIHAASQEE
jgi:hypothetical protein